MIKHKPSQVKVCHLTSAHTSSDSRIFIKECLTIAYAGYETHLVATGGSSHTKNGVHIHGVPKADRRLKRFTATVFRTYQKAQSLNAHIYHFHDPELILAGILLKLRGKWVIYDVHEDAPQQTLIKHWINPGLRRLVAWFMEGLDWLATKKCDGIIAATPSIAKRFPSSKTITVQNFPILNELMLDAPTAYQERPPIVVYAGMISAMRGIKEMVQAVGLLPADLNAQLYIAGSFDPDELENEIKKLSGWDRVKFLGWQSRQRIAAIFGQSRLGLVLFHPAPNHIKAQPSKLFEYMSAGIPVVASDFPLWKEIIESAGCGLLVDPLNPKAISEAIRWLLEHPKEAEVMGKRGQKLVRERYNWDREAEKLLNFYKKIKRNIDISLNHN